MGLIGTALGAVGSILGGVKASKAMKEAKRQVERQKKENRDWFDRRYNEDATHRADAQRVLSMTEDSIRRRNRAAAGTQAVMGGTDESTAAAKAANNQALADATAAIAAAGEARKDRIEQQYRERDAELDAQLGAIEAGRAQNIAQATSGVLGAAGEMDFGELKLKPGKDGQERTLAL